MPIARLITLLMMVFCPAIGWANEVVCDIEYASQVTPVRLEPVRDPYQLTHVDLRGNFRFSAQYLETANKLKTYVYHQSKGRYVLAHAAEYPLLKNHCTPPDGTFGLSRVYDPGLERELQYQCRQVCRDGG